MLNEEIEKYNLVKVDEHILNNMFSNYSENGFIIISFENDKITDPKERHEQFIKFKRDEVGFKRRYSYISVFGGYTEINPDTGEKREATSFVKALLVINYEFLRNNIPYTEDKLKEIGVELAKEYNQEFFLYKPKGNDTIAYFINANDYVIDFFTSVSIYKMIEKYFLNFFQSKNKEKINKGFSYVIEFYFPNTPRNAAEGFSMARYGEEFIKWK